MLLLLWWLFLNPSLELHTVALWCRDILGPGLGSVLGLGLGPGHDAWVHGCLGAWCMLACVGAWP